MGAVMIGNKTETNSYDAQMNGPASRSIANQVVGDCKCPEHLERLAPWLKFNGLLRGPLFWISIAAIGVSVFAIVLLTFLGWGRVRWATSLWLWG